MCCFRIEYADEKQSIDSFETVQKSILTMAYAMVGLFDPEVESSFNAFKSRP